MSFHKIMKFINILNNDFLKKSHLIEKIFVLSYFNFVFEIQLQTSSILNAPLYNYDKDFTFIVNGKEYNTYRIISDLLSSKISNIHKTDPTYSFICINTKN